MPHRIDLASFTCPDCGHISTPPDSINTFPSEMELYGELGGEHLPDKESEDVLVETLAQYHYANDFTIESQRVRENGEDDPLLMLKPEINPRIYKKVIKVERSYADVKHQSGTTLSDSDRIVLSCPQCHTTLYEADWTVKRAIRT